MLLVISFIGISKIVVNDNLVNWFKADHPLRQADVLMNEHLVGTYMSNLVFTSDNEAFKNPGVVNYMADVQQLIANQPQVGAVSSIVDILSKIAFELKGDNSLPQTPDEIGQCHFLYEVAGGDPEDLFKFVTSEYDHTHIWIQMTQGENLIMRNVVNPGRRVYSCARSGKTDCCKR